jgi:hypothetical protein
LHNFQAKELKGPFEKRVLKVLGQASSHHAIWIGMHPMSEESSREGAFIEANLKGKSRAREKAVLDYRGDFRCIVLWLLK